MLFDEKIGVIVVGETHLSVQQADEIQEALGQRMDIYHSPDPENPSTRGIAIVLNREITNTKAIKVWYLIPGRAILAVLPWHGRHTITVLGVYAPAESPKENKKFWDNLHDLWMTTDLPVPDTLLGDMNLTEEPIDRLPHRRDDDAATAALARLKRLWTLKDGWRAVNPDTKEYTYTSGRQTHSRLDRIMVSPTLFKQCSGWEISDAAGGLTDHKLVSVGIKAPGAPYIGKGHYTIPLFLLCDKEFMDFTVTRGEELARKFDTLVTDAAEIQNGFKAFKDEIREFAKKRAKLANRNRTQMKAHQPRQKSHQQLNLRRYSERLTL
ncbi:Endonuclease/exonuclease/phosphatase [Mycena filopes]|nr:Endonuclease/exonuclease/phosphatase [Mycena filopes]